jgi:hypothetical protein
LNLIISVVEEFNNKWASGLGTHGSKNKALVHSVWSFVEIILKKLDHYVVKCSRGLGISKILPIFLLQIAQLFAIKPGLGLKDLINRW